MAPSESDTPRPIAPRARSRFLVQLAVGFAPGHFANSLGFAKLRKRGGAIGGSFCVLAVDFGAEVSQLGLSTTDDANVVGSRELGWHWHLASAIGRCVGQGRRRVWSQSTGDTPVPPELRLSKSGQWLAWSTIVDCGAEFHDYFWPGRRGMEL